MRAKVKLDLPILLPDVPDARDRCARRLISRLELLDGIEQVHVASATDGLPDRLCIHYDATVLSLPVIRQMAERLGAELTDQFGHVVLKVEGLRHARRARTVAERVRRITGVVEAEATVTGLVRVEYDRDLATDVSLRRALREMAVRAVEVDSRSLASSEEHTGKDDREHGHEHGGILGEKSEVIFAILSGVFLIAGWLTDSYANTAASIPLIAYLMAYFFGGFFTLREAFDSVRVGRFEIDFLMLVAAAGAAALGEWAEGALLLFLFSLGHALEHYAMGRARKAIDALAELTPDTALVRRGDGEREVSVRELSIGDVVIVRTHERLPADGFVVRGTSAVNQAPVTGESVPVDKRPVDNPDDTLKHLAKLAPEHRVFAGTINGSGALEIVVTKRSSESTLARVVQMVTEAETDKSPTQRFTDRFERIFVPSVLGFTVLLLFAGGVVDEPFSASFYRAMAVLVAASPCALAIATPSAVLSAVARAGRSGVLVKGGGPLENLGELGAIAFDKTGTLTEGKPKVTNVVPAIGVAEKDLLRTAVAVEKLSDHPLAAAVVSYGKEQLDGDALGEAADMESILGRGIKAVLNGEPVYVVRTISSPK